MRSVLRLQGMRPSSSADLQAKSSVSLFKCGRTSQSKLSLAWCGTNVVRG